MITAVSHKQQNELVAALENMFREAEKAIDHVVLCYSDARLFSALTSLNLSGSAVTVLFVPQDKWNFECEELVGVIQWILKHEDVKHLSVVGTSSQAPAPRGSRWFCATEQSSEGFAKLIAGAQRHNLQTSQNQENFVSTLKQLLTLRMVQSRLETADVNLRGFFYRDEYGMFLRYSLEGDSVRLS